uniref:Transthyretin-like family-containing protein n=1 Tax=Rhabditophanes sp. KR3021 TaxID=114890 RepID=A0AC35TSS9_9BILA
MRLLYITALFITFFTTDALFGKKSFAFNLTETILCKGIPMSNLTMQMYEYDMIPPDDLLNTTATNEKGNYHITATHKEYFKINPYFLFRSTCGQKLGNCTVISKILINTKYANAGSSLVDDIDLYRYIDYQECGY